MNIIAIIPARGGSKGIKRKNLTPLKGEPLLSYSIKHAFQSKLITRVVVSSEDAEILEVARQYGAETPFVRPDELAGDLVLDLPVFVHALDFLRETEGYVADYVVHLRPTAPFREIGWIDEAIQMLIDNPDADSVRSVSPPQQHPYRVFRIGADGYLDPIMKHEHPQPYLPRRQDLPPMYYYNCVIDVTKPTTIYGKQSMTGDRMLPFVMDEKDTIDIDTATDLILAQQLFTDRL